MDAKAEGEKVVIGGWLSQGGRKTRDAPWFSLELTRATAPWAFARGEPFRTIAGLELLVSPVCLMVLVPVVPPRGDSSAVLRLSCGTDNQGNSHLLDRMLTTKYPFGVVLMELAHQPRIRRLVLRAHWLPRLEHEDADALSNFELRHFDPARRIEVNLKDLKFAVLDNLFREGESYIAELEKVKAQKKTVKASEGGQTGKRLKALKGETLKNRDGWQPRS